MMNIRPAAFSDISTIHQLANDTWWNTYRNIIADEQIRFMLTDLYSESALANQFDKLDFLIAERGGKPVAFAAISLTDAENKIYTLHKIYILPSEQGKGTGKALMNHIEELVKNRNGEILELNVNRGNPALGFYMKLGFTIYEEADIPYHQFVLNDYVMRKSVTNGDGLSL